MKIRLEVILKGGEGSYAGIVRRVKADLNFINSGENASYIRHSQKEVLMLELKEIEDIIKDKFANQIEKSQRQEAEISSSRSKITTVCKNMIDIPIKEEVREVLEKQFDLIGLQESAVKTIRKAYGGK